MDGEELTVATSEALASFVKDALARGSTRGQIEEVLRRAGWEAEQVRSALQAFADVEFPLPVPRPVPYLSAREAYLYLVLFTTLYLSAYNLGCLLFQFIDLAIPDPAFGALGSSTSSMMREGMRWCLASLIVAFPVFLYASRTTTHDLVRDPAKRGSKVRRWLTYLTLFLAASIIIGDAIDLLDNVLGGELTGRFVLKALTVAVISGGIFAYYLRDLRLDEQDPKP